MLTNPVESPAETEVDDAVQSLPERDTRRFASAQGIAPPDHSLPIRKRQGWRWIVILALASGAWFSRQYWLPILQSVSFKGSAATAKKEERPIPVRTAVVQRRDMPVLISGLGTVTAFKTVTLRSRVDGELVQVAFTEGQMVHEGDLLAEIDPRPFRAQLQQAEGTLAKDQATLLLAKITLNRGQDLLKKNSIAQQQIDEETAQVQTME